MNGYLLYRKEGKTCLVIEAEDDDELHYLLSKLERSRVKWLKEFAKELLADFFEKIHGDDPIPPVHEVRTRSGNTDKQK